MASQLSEAEERERAFSGRGRWNQVRSLAEAKNVMNYLFNLASSSRCQLWDKEVDCREKDSEIRNLKEKIVNLIRQVEMQKAELSRMEKIKKLYMSKSFKKNSINRDLSVMDDADGHMYDLRPKGLRNSIAYNSSGDIGEDMEISESEHSDEEWGHRRSDLDETDEEWGHRRRHNAKKRYSKVIIESSTDTGIHKASPLEDGDSNMLQKAPSGVCCSCSKYSSCKTLKCECRAAIGSCSTSCDCDPRKCSNRVGVLVQPDLGPPVTEDGIVNILSDVEESDKNSNELASHGAMLLQAALSDKPVEIKDAEDAKRKPLSDIGNKIAKTNAAKPPASRKKWKKSVAIQLVPVSSDQTSTQKEESEATTKQESSTVEPTTKPRLQQEISTGEPAKPRLQQESSTVEPAKPRLQQESSTVEPTKLRLPRAMRSAISNANSNPLRDRNTEPSMDSSSINKEGGPKSPRQHPRQTTKEKENHGQ
ncbi:hypothetical protein M8C21_030183 [Ambrosia artemisiifolia]|uniref:Tesmin/TSO1-like CXC domain-containing protein n=1 Tax=Ambrosia artemisiifolia TaxID=4212 RepID=A0AAD5G7J6_AMBAR|nr:hypothetical protein M8C21_030183 [Ambrosia artemisiifolia]